MLSTLNEISNRNNVKSAVIPEINEDAHISLEEKIQAAYALNLCTVSISQIIDYNGKIFTRDKN